MQFQGHYQAKMATVRKIRLYHLVFVGLYIYQIGHIILTAGEPYHQFLKKADREGFQGM